MRLDFGPNPRSSAIDYHWNQQGVAANFGVTNHATVGTAGAIAYNAAKYFRYAGRTLLVVGVTLDAVSIVVASKPLRRASEVVAGWAGAWAGCKVGGGAGAFGGSFLSPLGTAARGIIGCVVIGYGGYKAGSYLGGETYDWAEGTLFTPLPTSSAPR